MPEDEEANAVVLEYAGGATEPRDLLPGGQETYFRLPYTVTDEDVAANLVSVRFLVPTLGLFRALAFVTKV